MAGTPGTGPAQACSGKVFTHRRVVIRLDRYVATVDLYCRDETATPELATWFARKMSERMRLPEPEPADYRYSRQEWPGW